MHNTIHKFTIDAGHRASWLLALPLAAKALLVAQGPRQEPETFQVWFELDADAPTLPRQFKVIGTGHAVPSGVLHVGSVVCPPFVWHLYEEPQGNG